MPPPAPTQENEILNDSAEAADENVQLVVTVQRTLNAEAVRVRMARIPDIS
ncbi:hypothetical protein CDV57_09717 [Aspergillus fumigatus]|nr:hypothetical protein CDV57_09717 [Aspergillus fumigatus]